MIKITWLARLLKKAFRNKLTTVPDLVIGDPENPYLLRWYIIPRNRIFNIYLHVIRRSDDDRALHDHPWWNISFILDGSMLEVMPSKVYEAVPVGKRPTIKRYLKQGNLVGRGAKAAHRLEVRENSICTTLFITGPRIRQWGFHCPQGWRHWKIFTSFNETGNSTQVGRGCGEQ